VSIFLLKYVKIDKLEFTNEKNRPYTLIHPNREYLTLISSLINRYNDEVEKSRFLRLLNGVQIMLTTFFFADYFPFIGGWLDKLAGVSSKIERMFNDLDEFCNKIINDHLDPNQPKPDNEDIVDVLLQFRKEHCFSFHLTFDHIKAVLLVNSFDLGYLNCREVYFKLLAHLIELKMI